MIRIATAALLATLAVTAARAQEPRGCDKFKWNLDAEQRALGAEPRLVENGAAVGLGSQGHAVALVSLDRAGLAMAPERNPGGSATRAGFVRIAAPPAAGLVQVTVSEAVWIDLVQDGQFVRPAAFSGALDCADVRKSVRFPVAAKPFVLQFSGAAIERVGFTLAPAGP